MSRKYFFICGAILLVIISVIPSFYTFGLAGSPAIHRTGGDEKEGIIFLEGQWTAAREKAAAEHKYIFVDAYATWCGPCKMLKRTTFKDGRVAAFFNEHFINVSLDVEKGEGVDFASSWKITAIPTLMIFDASGRPVLQSKGFMRAEDLLNFGKHALVTSDSER